MVLSGPRLSRRHREIRTGSKQSRNEGSSSHSNFWGKQSFTLERHAMMEGMSGNKTIQGALAQVSNSTMGRRISPSQLLAQTGA